MVASVAPEHEVRVLDFMFLDDPLAQVDRTVGEFRPDLIGISVRNIDNQDSVHPEAYFPQVKELVDHLKELGPAPVVLGGAGFSVAPREFMEFTGADFGLVGEGEESFAGFLQAYPGRDWEKVPGLIWRQEGGLRLNPLQHIRRLNLLPRPAREHFTPRLYEETPGSAGLTRSSIMAATPSASAETVSKWTWRTGTPSGRGERRRLSIPAIASSRYGLL